MTIAPYAPEHVRPLLDLCGRLREDPWPCSWWGVDRAAAEALLDRPCRITRVALLDGRLAGVASALASAVEDSGRREGIELLKALVWTENAPSRALFASLGYEHRATLMAEFKGGGQEFDNCVFYKRLHPA